MARGYGHGDTLAAAVFTAPEGDGDGFRGAAMRLTIRAFGLDLLDVELSTDSPSPEPDDYSRDLSGGTLAYDRIDAGPTDYFMGFSNGREVE